MANFSHCTIHNTFPKDGEPCWSCVNQFGDKELRAERDYLEDLINEVREEAAEVKKSFKTDEKLQAENDRLRKENEALGWFVSALADVFNYNEYSQISPADVTAWLNTVVQADNFTKDDYKKIHALIIERGLVTLPTSKKAIEALSEDKDDG